MIKRNKWVFGLVLGIVMVIGISGLSFAQRSWQTFDSLTGSDVPSEYRLTQEQAQEMDTVQKKYQDQILPLERDIAAKQVEMEAEWSKSDVDPDRMRGLRREIRDLQDQVEDSQIQAELAFSKILSPEQQRYFGDSLDMFDGSMWSCRWNNDNNGGKMGMHGDCRMDKDRGSMMAMRGCGQKQGWWNPARSWMGNKHCR